MLGNELTAKSQQWMDVVKIGRTHLEDAVPLTVGQEWSGYAAQLDACVREVEHSREGLLELALGGTAVGTGLNAPAGFSINVASEIAEITGKKFATAPNKFAAQGSLDPMVRAHAALRGSQRGDLRVGVHVVTPTRLDAKERSLIEEFAKRTKAPTPHLAEFHQGLFAKLRDRFRNG